MRTGMKIILSSLLGLLVGVSTGVAAEKATDSYALGTELAKEGFSSLAFLAFDRSVRETVSFEALDSLTQLQSKNALFDLPVYDSLLPALITKARGSQANQEILARFAFRSVLQRISTKQNPSALLTAIPDTSSLDQAAKGLVAADKSDWKTAKTALAEALKSTTSESKDIQGAIRLAYARSLYALGENAAAISEYEKLFKIGLPMQDALIESAWAHLRTKNYVKSIGLSYELTTGKLAQFFAPEAISIRAISFLENCRYSESRNVIERFTAVYAPVTRWLKASEKSSTSLYETAIARSEGAVGGDTVPEKVWSMWTGSDLFVSTQKGIRQSFEESRNAPEWITDNAGNAKIKAILEADLKLIAAARARAASRIETHLEELNRSMAARIAAESERLRFVKIEANQGAGRDLVYRNANPGMADVEKKLEKAERKEKSYKGKLAWGVVKAEDPSAELWIDEIGNFEATTLDRCKVKKAYKGI